MDASVSLDRLLDHSQDKVALLDDGATFVYVNAAAERILGFAPDALVGECAFDYVHPEDVDEVRRAFERTVESETFTEVTEEYRHRTAGGDWVWLESRVSNLTDDHLDGYVVSSRDVTDRVRAERRQAETEARLAEISEVTDHVLWVFTADWSELLFVNPAFEDVYGMPTETLRENPAAFLDTVHPEDVPAVEDAMARLSAGESVDVEYRVNPEEDYQRWVWVQGAPVFEDGEVLRITGFSRDVTDRRNRERQLVVMDNLLRHNLRNDLNVVLGAAADAADAAPEVADQMAVVRRHCRRLLASAQKERRVIDLLTEKQCGERVDLRAAVDDAVAAARSRYPAATVAASASDGVVVRGRRQLRDAVEELVENAVRHGDDEPTVDVTLRASDGDAELVVADDGPRMPEVEANVLRGNHDMDEVSHSTGIGLWLVYWSVELSGGEVAVDSSADGNRVTVTLPLDAS